MIAYKETHVPLPMMAADMAAAAMGDQAGHLPRPIVAPFTLAQAPVWLLAATHWARNMASETFLARVASTRTPQGATGSSSSSARSSLSSSLPSSVPYVTVG